MINNFDISGHYYIHQNLLCRKFLDIKRKKEKIYKPDLMVIMMNPGSSKPIDGNNNAQTTIKAKPDNTQYQIIKLMNICELDYTRVLNLSDIRESKSKKFFKVLEKLDLSHSIFYNNRDKDFKELFVYGVPVIFAWGVDTKLQILAYMAIKKINSSNPVGILKNGSDFAYYHPLPQNSNKQKLWIQTVSTGLNNLKNR
ncbi:MAG: hypothetical protein DRG11_02220 [Epsilonproteobacteria bacterium]|nr:MAG: hypothetical protein DRG11_02220 [Campylobacterota bacterium]